MGELSGLFGPDCVAVVGATEREGSVGAAITRNLLTSFDGDVVPVNPNATSVFGVAAVDSVVDAPDVDLAVVIVPPGAVLEVLRQCGEAGVRNVVVVTAGFGETGSDGADRERRLTELANEYDLNVVGPNSLGVMSTPSGLNATFGPDDALPGNISFMSQSGAFVTAAVDWANDQRIGFRDVASLGNKAVLDETDLLREWGHDPGTDVVIGYLEGIDDGSAFIRTARSVTASTPVVLVKSGRTQAGAQAASSHTGSMAGRDRAHEAGFRQAGVIRADSIQELFDAARILSGQPLPVTERVAIVTNAGGPGVMATDAVGNASLSLADFSAETNARLRETLPKAATVDNPVDVIGDADVDRIRTALDVVLADEAVGSAVVLTAPTAVLEYDELATAIVDAQEIHGLPIAACLMGGRRVEAPRETLERAGIPCYFDPGRAVYSLDVLAEYSRIRDTEWAAPTRFDVNEARAKEILSAVVDRETNRLGVEAMGILDAYGIPIPDGEIVDDAADAQRVAAEIDGPVAMKVVSPDIVHKTDIGGVKLGVDLENVRDGYEELIARARTYQPEATLYGVQIQEMVDVDAGTETVLGAVRDPQFGPLLMFGLGGIFVEVLEDTTFRVAPIAAVEAREMTEEFRAAPLLRGARGRDPVDIDAVVETIQRLSQLVTDVPAILELDVNPLVALPDGVRAVDVRLTVDPQNL